MPRETPGSGIGIRLKSIITGPSQLKNAVTYIPGLNTHHRQIFGFWGIPGTRYLVSNLIGRKTKGLRAFFCCKSNSILGVGPTWARMPAVGQRLRGIPARFSIASMTTPEAIKREPQREATWITAAPMPSAAYPGGGASKKSWRSQSPTLETILPGTRY